MSAKWIPSEWLVGRSLTDFAPGTLVFRHPNPYEPGRFEVGVRLASPLTVYVLTNWSGDYYKPGQIPAAPPSGLVFGLKPDPDRRLILDIDMSQPLSSYPGGQREQWAGLVSLSGKGMLLHGFRPHNDPSEAREVALSTQSWSEVTLGPQEEPSTYTRAWRLRLGIADDWQVIFEPPAKVPAA